MYIGNIDAGHSYSKLNKCVTINILDFAATSAEVMSAYFSFNLENLEAAEGSI